MVETSHTSGFWPSLSEPLRGLGARIADWFAPPSEAKSAGDAYQISLELAGVKPGDIDVSVHGNMLTIKGHKKSAREEKTDAVYFCERQYGAFERSFRLPADASTDKVEAGFTDGVLILTIPRAATTPAGARKIEIRTA